MSRTPSTLTRSSLRPKAARAQPAPPAHLADAVADLFHAADPFCRRLHEEALTATQPLLTPHHSNGADRSIRPQRPEQIPSPPSLGCYFPREVFFFGLGLPVLAAFSVAAFFCFFATTLTPFGCRVSTLASHPRKSTTCRWALILAPHAPHARLRTSHISRRPIAGG
jgi:hypothetical protein